MLPNHIKESKTPPILGSVPLAMLCDSVHQAYEICVYLRINLFNIPSGDAGREYINQCTRSMLLIHQTYLLVLIQ